MGKLNYTNRKISGSKLGSAVKKDVLKHCLATPSKSRAVKDPHLEVNLQAKALGDEGLEIACDGLRQALDSGSIHLDELHLAENKITLNGLKFLGDVVQRASRDLKDLDLRANDLQIVTQEDAEHWESFLKSFKEVCCLRRLDISENPIGDRGFEILLKVYARELPVYLPKALRSTISDPSDDDYATDEFDGDSDMEDIYEQARNMSLSPKGLGASALASPFKSDTVFGLPKSTSVRSIPTIIDSDVELQGLRSIPYLILSRTGITDRAALFLSYILPVHYTPERLMLYFPMPKTRAEIDVLEAYYLQKCRGIVYKPNDALSSLSNRLLDCAEAMREGRSVHLVQSHKNPFYSPKKGKEGIAPAFRLVSSRSPPSLLELERARSKIQGALLNHDGPHCIALWSAALQVLVISRQVLFDRNAGPFEGHTRCFGRSVASLPLSPISTTFVNSSHGKSHSPPITPLRKTISGPMGSLAGSHVETPPRLAYTRSLPALNPPGLKAFDKECVEANMRIEKTSENGLGKGSHSNTDTTTPVTQITASAAAKVLPGGLPDKIWKRIIAMAADPENLLSNKQLSNMFDWAKTGDTIEKERELSGKLRSQQIWRILEATECLAYEGL